MVGALAKDCNAATGLVGHALRERTEGPMTALRPLPIAPLLPAGHALSLALLYVLIGIVLMEQGTKCQEQ